MLDEIQELNNYNQASINVYAEEKIKLKKLIDDCTLHYTGKQKLNQFLSIGIGLLGIGLSLGATIAGIAIDNARIAAIFGACAATTQGLLFAYPVDKRAAAYRVIAAKNKNLSIDLEVKNQTDEQLQNLIEEFKAIRLEAAIEESRVSDIEDIAIKLKDFLEKQGLQAKDPS